MKPCSCRPGDPECPHPALCEACGENPATCEYEARTGIREGEPFWRSEPRLWRLCEPCRDEFAEADAAAERELDEIAHSDAEQMKYERDRDRRFEEKCTG